MHQDRELWVRQTSKGTLSTSLYITRQVDNIWFVTSWKQHITKCSIEYNQIQEKGLEKGVIRTGLALNL